MIRNTYKLTKCCIAVALLKTVQSVFRKRPACVENRLDYPAPSLTAAKIRTRIKEALEDLLNADINKAEKSLFIAK